MHICHKYRALTSLLLLLFAVEQAYAAVPTCEGWYVEGNVGTARTWGWSFPPSASVSRSSFPFGWNINAGYKFIKYLGAEVGFTSYYGTKDYDIRVLNSGGDQAATYRHVGLDAAAKLMIPFDSTGLEPFAKLGVAGINSTSSVTNQSLASSMGIDTNSHNSFGPYLALGLAYYITPDLSANVQWAEAFGNNNGVGRAQLISGGLTMLFPY